MQLYASIADIDARYPDQLTLIAANEQTGLRDDARITSGLTDASAEIQAILAARYSAAELAQLDEASLAVLRLYCIDIAFFRIALDFSRCTDAIKERYAAAIKRLEAIASGRGALTIVAMSSGGIEGEADGIGANEVILTAPGRIFTRERLGRI
jgi:phage gp36-like protein